MKFKKIAILSLTALLLVGCGSTNYQQNYQQYLQHQMDLDNKRHEREMELRKEPLVYVSVKFAGDEERDPTIANAFPDTYGRGAQPNIEVKVAQPATATSQVQSQVQPPRDSTAETWRWLAGMAERLGFAALGVYERGESSKNMYDFLGTMDRTIVVDQPFVVDREVNQIIEVEKPVEDPNRIDLGDYWIIPRQEFNPQEQQNP